jgi:hypothetical protein
MANYQNMYSSSLQLSRARLEEEVIPFPTQIPSIAVVPSSYGMSRNVNTQRRITILSSLQFIIPGGHLLKEAEIDERRKHIPVEIASVVDFLLVQFLGKLGGVGDRNLISVRLQLFCKFQESVVGLLAREQIPNVLDAPQALDALFCHAAEHTRRPTYKSNF